MLEITIAFCVGLSCGAAVMARIKTVEHGPVLPVPVPSLPLDVFLERYGENQRKF